MPRRLLILSGLVTVAILAGACARSGATPPDSIPPAARTPTPQPGVSPTHRDLAYADGARTLDLYLPPRTDTVPVAVWLHGGSWVAGDKRPLPGVLLGLRERGFAVAAVNYRLSGLSSFPAQVQDVKGSVRWLRAHAGEYGLDPSRVFLVGFSAGGHLASLAALTAGDPVLEGDVGGNVAESSAVAGVVVYAGPSDLPRLAGECTNCEVSEEFQALGCAFLLCGERGRAASALTHVSGSAPPFLLLHGGADRVVPPEQSRLLEEALRAVGAPVELRVIAGAPHGLLGASADEATRAFLLGLAGLGR